MKKAAVVGGGVFGGTSAWYLANNGYSVDLFEEKNDIFCCASGINQFRLHRGYHYPRSRETIQECLKGEREFRKVYGDCVIDNHHEHYYAVAKEDSFLNKNQVLRIWDESGLEYQTADLDILNSQSIEGCLRVKESVFDPVKLKEAVWEKMKLHNVNVIVNKKAAYRELEVYDVIVVATYALNNSLLQSFPDAQRDYQFELIEKLVLDLPQEYKNMSIVINDGPFTCIDPYGSTELALMGNVVHAIHHQNIGKLPVIPSGFISLINSGIVRNPEITHIEKFLNAAERFFPGIKDAAKHIGSMYTIRTVLPYREHDDARPTIVEQIDERVISVFSGKIPTCINAARQVLQLANDIAKISQGI
jgi:hypothetical protein